MIVLVPNCAFLSETSRILAIYRALVARGADACIATHGGPYTRVLDREGVPYTVIGTGWSDERARTFVASIPGIGDPRTKIYPEEELRTLIAEEVRLFRERDASCVVTGFALTTLLSSRVAGIPLVTDHAGSWVPPVSERKMLPAPMRSTLPLGQFFPESLSRWLANVMPARVGLWCGPFNRVAAELGVERVPSFAALLLGDLTLVTDCPEVLGIPQAELEAWRPDPRRYRPATRLRYTGPLFAELAMPVPERVEEFLSVSRAKRPLAYVAMTSTPADLIRGVVGAVRAAGARVLVAATIHALPDLEGDDVMVEPLLPSHKVMPRCDVAVIAGGQGSVQTAMASGVPFVGVPLQPEQDFNIVEMERHGAARRISQEDAVGAHMTSLVREICADDGFSRAAKGIQAIYAKADGPGAAADAILELVAKERSAAAPLGPSRRAEHAAERAT
jgi:UDP:flavonoid glycosyltransferase YjiC (YdhE family)